MQNTGKEPTGPSKAAPKATVRALTRQSQVAVTRAQGTKTYASQYHGGTTVLNPATQRGVQLASTSENQRAGALKAAGFSSAIHATPQQGRAFKADTPGTTAPVGAGEKANASRYAQAHLQRIRASAVPQHEKDLTLATHGVALADAGIPLTSTASSWVGKALGAVKGSNANLGQIPGFAPNQMGGMVPGQQTFFSQRAQQNGWKPEQLQTTADLIHGAYNKPPSHSLTDILTNIPSDIANIYPSTFLGGYALGHEAFRHPIAAAEMLGKSLAAPYAGNILQKFEEHPVNEAIAFLPLAKATTGLAGKAAGLEAVPRTVEAPGLPTIRLPGETSTDLAGRGAQLAQEALIKRSPRVAQEMLARNVETRINRARDVATSELHPVETAFQKAHGDITKAQSLRLAFHEAQGVTPQERAAFYDKMAVEARSRGEKQNANAAEAQAELSRKAATTKLPTASRQKAFLDSLEGLAQHREQIMGARGDLSPSENLYRRYQPAILAAESRGDPLAHTIEGLREESTNLTKQTPQGVGATPTDTVAAGFEKRIANLDARIQKASQVKGRGTTQLSPGAKPLRSEGQGAIRALQQQRGDLLRQYQDHLEYQSTPDFGPSRVDPLAQGNFEQAAQDYRQALQQFAEQHKAATGRIPTRIPVQSQIERDIAPRPIGSFGGTAEGRAYAPSTRFSTGKLIKSGRFSTTLGPLIRDVRAAQHEATSQRILNDLQHPENGVGYHLNDGDQLPVDGRGNEYVLKKLGSLGSRPKVERRFVKEKAGGLSQEEQMAADRQTQWDNATVNPTEGFVPAGSGKVIAIPRAVSDVLRESLGSKPRTGVVGKTTNAIKQALLYSSLGRQGLGNLFGNLQQSLFEGVGARDWGRALAGQQFKVPLLSRLEGRGVYNLPGQKMAEIPGVSEHGYSSQLGQISRAEEGKLAGAKNVTSAPMRSMRTFAARVDEASRRAVAARGLRLEAKNEVGQQGIVGKMRAVTGFVTPELKRLEQQVASNDPAAEATANRVIAFLNKNQGDFRGMRPLGIRGEKAKITANIAVPFWRWQQFATQFTLALPWRHPVKAALAAAMSRIGQAGAAQQGAGGVVPQSLQQMGVSPFSGSNQANLQMLNLERPDTLATLSQSTQSPLGMLNPLLPIGVGVGTGYGLHGASINPLRNALGEDLTARGEPGHPPSQNMWQDRARFALGQLSTFSPILRAAFQPQNAPDTSIALPLLGQQDASGRVSTRNPLSLLESLYNAGSPVPAANVNLTQATLKGAKSTRAAQSGAFSARRKQQATALAQKYLDAHNLGPLAKATPQAQGLAWGYAWSKMPSP